MTAKQSFTNFANVNTKAKHRLLVIFGAGNICGKTLRRLSSKPNYIVDNSANLWGTQQDGITIQDPSYLNRVDERPFIIICTTSFPEVTSQLVEMGFSSQSDFCVSPILNDWRTVDEVERASAKLILTSGLSSSGTTKGHGGLYLLRIQEDGHEIKHVVRGSAHGIIQRGHWIYVIEDELGITEFDRDLKILRHRQLPSGSRAHGLAWSEKTECFYVACSYLDQVLELDHDFQIQRRIDISTKTHMRGGPHHHINDCLVWDDSLFVSMFSLTGNWKKDVFDGGVLEIDISSGRTIGSFAQGLWMPHNIANVNGTLAILDSLPGSLLMGNLNEIGNFPGFTRGLSWDDSFMYIGQSRNRNFSNQIGISNNISLDSGVVVFDPETKLSKTAQLPRHITEIHGLLVLE